MTWTESKRTDAMMQINRLIPILSTRIPDGTLSKAAEK